MSTLEIRDDGDGYVALLVDGKIVLTSGLDDGTDYPDESPLSQNRVVSETAESVARALGDEITKTGVRP